MIREKLIDICMAIVMVSMSLFLLALTALIVYALFNSTSMFVR